MHIMSIRLNKEEYKALYSYAKTNGISMNKALKDAFFDKLEDEYDIKLFNEAYAEYKKNPKTYTMDEVFKELDL